MKLEWSRFAMADRDEIFDYIEADDPDAAAAVDDRIADATTRLIAYPESGRLGRVTGTRELIVRRSPYVIAYRILGDTVHILRVIHGARLWPEDLPDPEV